MNNKDMKQTLKRLKKEGLIVAQAGGGERHIRLTLCNGACYIVASSSSDWRAVRNVEAGIRRTVATSV
jgi:hypothetical protein